MCILYEVPNMESLAHFGVLLSINWFFKTMTESILNKFLEGLWKNVFERWPGFCEVMSWRRIFETDFSKSSRWL
jgi:hypothetical protein